MSNNSVKFVYFSDGKPIPRWRKTSVVSKGRAVTGLEGLAVAFAVGWRVAWGLRLLEKTGALLGLSQHPANSGQLPDLGQSAGHQMGWPAAALTEEAWCDWLKTRLVAWV
jgi:hypothetical protein